MSSKTIKIDRSQIALKVCVAFFVACSAVVVVCSNDALGQHRDAGTLSCQVGVHAPPHGFWTWEANTQVKVYVVSAGFKTEEISYLLRPLEPWNAVADLTTSRVRFIYAGSVLEPQNCNKCLTILRGNVVDKRHLAELHAASEHGDQIISNAKIILDPQISNPNALTNIVAHELGHNLGLLDCNSCLRRSTVMNVIRRADAMEGPTLCDVAQVKAAYEELKRHVRPAPEIAKVTADEGEEPVEDDTPIVIPPPEGTR